MPPPDYRQRLSDVESVLQKHQLIVDAVTKDQHTTEDKVERVVRAVFGDQDNMVQNPGVIVTVARLEDKQMETNKILTGLREDVHRVAWIIIGANIAALLALIIKR